MIEKINDVPDNMVAFRAMGSVSQHDFTNLVIPEVEKLVSRTGKLNYMLVLDTSPKEFTVGAWLEDAFLGLKNITKWNRAAIITDSEGIQKFTDVFSALMPGDFRGFNKADIDRAIDWVSEKININ